MPIVSIQASHSRGLAYTIATSPHLDAQPLTTLTWQDSFTIGIRRNVFHPRNPHTDVSSVPYHLFRSPWYNAISTSKRTRAVGRWDAEAVPARKLQHQMLVMHMSPKWGACQAQICDASRLISLNESKWQGLLLVCFAHGSCQDFHLTLLPGKLVQCGRGLRHKLR